MRRVVITGIGLVTPLGIGQKTFWKALMEGQSAIGPIRRYDPASLQTRFGAEIPEFDAAPFVENRRSLRMMTRNDQLAVAGAVLAMQEGGVDKSTLDGDRVGLFVGGNKEISHPESLLEGALCARQEDGTADVRKLGDAYSPAFHPLFYVEGLQAASLFYISQAFCLRGANTYFAGTAEAGAVAIGRAFRSVRRGESLMALSGGFDDAISWWSMSKMDGFGVLADCSERGASAFCPYDRNRSGTLLGEGAAFLLVEDYASAYRRNATIYAEVVGFGSSHEGHNLMTPDPEGYGLAAAIRAALNEACCLPEQIGYVAAHGSGTRLGDTSETNALRAVFGTAADRLMASSTKPATGHLVGGAGALNAAVAALALHYQAAPPTLNLEDLDPACKLDWIPKQGREIKADHALAIARGMEGQSVALVLRKH